VGSAVNIAPPPIKPRILLTDFSTPTIRYGQRIINGSDSLTRNERRDENSTQRNKLQTLHTPSQVLLTLSPTSEYATQNIPPDVRSIYRISFKTLGKVINILSHVFIWFGFFKIALFALEFEGREFTSEHLLVVRNRLIGLLFLPIFAYDLWQCKFNLRQYYIEHLPLTKSVVPEPEDSSLNLKEDVTGT
jgi:hypothetical protein